MQLSKVTEIGIGIKTKSSSSCLLGGFLNSSILGTKQYILKKYGKPEVLWYDKNV